MKYLTFAALITFQGIAQARAWTSFLKTNRNNPTKLSSTASSSSVTNDIQEGKTSSISSAVVAPPSWDELSTHLDDIQGKQGEGEKEMPLITLYRDTNGWCPFCERVWFALKIKKIPYQETLISLFDKPKWFLDTVPTGLVPVVLIHTDTMKDQERQTEKDFGEEEKKISPQRVLIWESLDILKALDEYFPDTPQLIHENDESYMKGREVMNELTAAGFAYSYNMRNSSLTMEEKELQRVTFEEKLDDLENFIGLDSKSPFFLGEISGLDVEAIPTLERWRYQLPLVKNMDITDGRPNLKQWFDAMDEYQPYVERVAGDEYSWTVVASTYLKYFGGADNEGGLSDEVKDIMVKVEEEAEVLRSKFELNPHDSGLFTEKMLNNGRIEAAAKLITNHEAVANDCTNTDPKSQQELGRAEDVDGADWVLRQVTAKLLDFTSSETGDQVNIDKSDATTAAKTVANRLCVPRDMGAPAAAVLRHELVKVTSELEE